jgi:ribosomal protein L33
MNHKLFGCVDFGCALGSDKPRRCELIPPAIMTLKLQYTAITCTHQADVATIVLRQPKFWSSNNKASSASIDMVPPPRARYIGTDGHRLCSRILKLPHSNILSTWCPWSSSATTTYGRSNKVDRLIFRKYVKELSKKVRHEEQWENSLSDTPLKLRNYSKILLRKVLSSNSRKFKSKTNDIWDLLWWHEEWN